MDREVLYGGIAVNTRRGGGGVGRGLEAWSTTRRRRKGRRRVSAWGVTTRGTTRRTKSGGGGEEADGGDVKGRRSCR